MKENNTDETTKSSLKSVETKGVNTASAWKDWAEEQIELNDRQTTPRVSPRVKNTPAVDTLSFTKEQFEKSFPSPSLCFCRKPAYRSYTREFGPVLECGNYQVILDHSKAKTKYVCSFHVHEISWEEIKNKVIEETKIDVDLPELRNCPYYNFTFCTMFHLSNDYLKTPPSTPLCFCNQPTILRVANRDNANDLSCLVELSCENYDIDGAKSRCCWNLSAKEVAFPRPKENLHIQVSKKEYEKTLSSPPLQARSSPLSFLAGHKNVLLSALMSPGDSKSSETCPAVTIKDSQDPADNELLRSPSSSLSDHLSNSKPALVSTVKTFRQSASTRSSPTLAKNNREEPSIDSEQAICSLNKRIEKLELLNRTYREKYEGIKASYQILKAQTTGYQQLLDKYQDESEENTVLRINCQERLALLEIDVVKMVNEKEELLQKLKSVSEDDSREEKRCIVCFNQPIEYAIAPCFHFAYCFSCSSRLEECAICRQPVIGIHKIFNC